MMAFCQRTILVCALRSTQAASNTTSALQPLFRVFVTRRAQGSVSVRRNSNIVTETTSATSAAIIPPQLLTAVSQRLCSHFTSWSECPPNKSFSHGLAPSANITEYKCPATVLLENLSQIAILDETPTKSLCYECPVAVPVIDSVAPDLRKSEIVEPGSKPEAKEAKMIMRIRHKKMKKHKLKKLRKRMYFLWKKQKSMRKAKRMTVYTKELEAIKATGEDFNAEEFVRGQLAKARRGGYYINVLETKL